MSLLLSGKHNSYNSLNKIKIDNDIIEFNESNYDFIKENYPNLIYKNEQQYMYLVNFV